MNIFNVLPHYAGKWSVKSSRSFTADEISAVKEAHVVDSQYGLSVCFMMHSGDMTFIPLSNDSDLITGDTVDLANAQLLTLEKSGESDIYRVKA